MKTTSLFVLLTLALSCAAAARGQTLEWARQLGSGEDDSSASVSADGLGNVYISGITRGDLDGPNAGGHDAFISMYDDSGVFQWTRQLGTSERDDSTGVSADGLGGVYISGQTYGSLEGTNAGGWDAFISKYDDSGTLQWTRQFGTIATDEGNGVSADGLGNVYISGRTEGNLDGTNASGRDAFLRKYDGSGAHQWTRQLDSGSDEFSWGVSADALGSVYISGYTEGDLDGTSFGFVDAFVSKYDADGTLDWTRQLGTSALDESFSVSADGLGGVYISGHTRGDLEGTNPGSLDAFLSSYDADGTLQWTRQFGTSSDDRGLSVSADGLGGVYISGWTQGDLDGMSSGATDAFISKYDAGGTLQWRRLLGTSSNDWSYGVSADGLGNAYISGNTDGNLDGTSAGGSDAFVAKFSEPTPGDANGDGMVDGVDYVIWAINFGDDPADDPPGSPFNGDYNNDGVVDGVDYIIWASNYGQGPNDSVAVPEPGTLVLALLAGVGLLLAGRR